MPLTDDLRYSKVSMSAVLKVLLHCSAKKIRFAIEFLNPISVGEGDGSHLPLKVFPSPLPSIDRL